MVTGSTSLVELLAGARVLLQRFRTDRRNQTGSPVGFQERAQIFARARKFGTILAFKEV